MKSKSAVYESSLELLENIVKDVFKGEEVTVVLFGSRAREDYLQTSDVDIGILSEEKVPKDKIALFRERIENSNIPYKVDIVDLSQASREFRDNVLREGLLLWRS